MPGSRTPSAASRSSPNAAMSARPLRPSRRMPTLADQAARPDAFTAWITRMRAAVDASLGRAIPAAPVTPPVLDAGLRYALLGGGKRVRPLLALATADAILGSEPETCRLAMPAACALELIHTYSLVHDDL